MQPTCNEPVDDWRDNDGWSDNLGEPLPPIGLPNSEQNPDLELRLLARAKRRRLCARRLLSVRPDILGGDVHKV